MVNVKIFLQNNKTRYQSGETIYGSVELSERVPIDNVTISLHCKGEVKWREESVSSRINNWFSKNDQEYYNQMDYLEEKCSIKLTELDTEKKDCLIDFQVYIPCNRNLPSSMVSSHGFIEYFIKVNVKMSDEIKSFKKILIVQSPLRDNLMVTVGGNAEKFDLLHTGKIMMHASIGRKGYTPGETISVHICVQNHCSASATPRISLRQIQIFMSGARHKSIETTINHEAVVGCEIEPNSEAAQQLQLSIPSHESLSIASSLITVKYFVWVTLDIPHSSDLHIQLPVVVTSASEVKFSTV